MPLVEIMQGRIVGDDYSGKSYTFLSPKNGGEEVFVAAAAKDLLVRMATRPVKFPARSNIMHEIGGEYFLTTYEIPEGHIIKVFARDESVPHGKRAKMACQFLQVREEGPYTELRISIPGNVPDASNSRWHVRGRMDVISLEHAKSEGCHTIPNCDYMFAPSSVQGVFETVELSPAVSAKVEHTVIDAGGGRVLKETKKRRRMGGF